MRHRLYYFLPDIESARRTFDDMLLNRIEQRHVRFLTGGTPLPNDMPEASVLLKTDMLHGLAIGTMVGAVLGIAFGALLTFYYELPQAAILVTTLIGLLFGGWAASMVAAALPNSRLKAFSPELEKGKVLMIADVPARRVKQIETMLAERHPEMRFGGEEPNMPVFP
ncbi:MAG: DUF1269 domain-containing protein [Burkholderiales bacterium RIFCSPLOWO2_02_FULL_57_36]|nr:MAG: DUF1269 domain-containing protein [Burkholderiales bacterium RIFCSPLOWO2_02_FULL_57_36]